VLPGRPTVILDVAHNPHAASALALNLGNMGFHPYTYAVFGIMQDKDVDGVIAPMAQYVDHWCVADLPSARSSNAAALAARLATLPAGDAKAGERSALHFADPAAAFANAMSRAGENDRIVVFGSFYTVAGVMAARKTSHY
jgi:dihydrofolate synthase/folylpolyglutamate synthase